jgi:hypothetical protein
MNIVVTSDHLLYIYYETKCVMGHQLSQVCEMLEKIFVFSMDHEHGDQWPSFIYIYDET